jgi:aminoglycoside phosphotransferase (APT) family kinase protein
VITVNIDVVERLIRRADGFGAARVVAVEPLRGGFWATISLVELADAPVDHVVLRVMPDGALATKEIAFQRAAADQGFPTPRVLDAGTDECIGGPYVLMDRALGVTPLGDLDVGAALRRLPSILRDLPRLLGAAMAQLHMLDPTGAEGDLTAAGVTADVDDMIAGLRSATARSDVRAALDWLERNRPSSDGRVLCHGDLHPFNLLVDGDRWAVIDWTAARIADPAFDVAFTTLMLTNPPMVTPAPLRPVVRGIGWLLGRRFRAAYGRAISDESLRWFSVLHAVRILVEVEAWGGVDRAGHPWVIMRPVAERLVASAR